MDNFTIGGLTLYEIIWYFILYSFLGWVLEVVYQAVSKGKVVNRGFLNGPVCPIYGFGMIGVFLLFNSLFPGGAYGMNGALLFGFGLLLATLIELIGGFALDKMFHARWWDYSNEPFNLNGYICPKFSLYWGFAIVFAVRIFHPFLARITVDAWPKQYGWPAAVLLSLIYAADVVVTVMIVNGLNRELERLDDIRESMRVGSDSLSEFLGTESIKTAQRMQEGRIQAELAKAELKEQAASAREKMKDQSSSLRTRIEGRLQELISKQNKLFDEEESLFRRLLKPQVFGVRRLLTAFPNMRSTKHKEALESIKNKLDSILP